MSEINLHIPLQLIKGKAEDGTTSMKMKGIASTMATDSDGENLDPSGFETDYFIKYGFMNWNHQTNKDPLSVVGRPTGTKINKANELEIDFELFEKSPKAIQVFQLQEILESQGMALGLSIEGKVIERKSDDKTSSDYKIITKAQITGCAITPNPKNADTIAKIIKSEKFEKLSAYDDMSEEEREKALTAGSASGQAVSKESLDGDLKSTLTKYLTKSQIFDKIFRDLPSLSNESVVKLFNLTERIQKSIIMKETDNAPIEISTEALSKAYEILGLEAPDTIEKGKKKGDDMRKTYTEKMSKDEIAKMDGMDEKDKDTYAKGCYSAAMEKADADAAKEGVEGEGEEKSMKKSLADMSPEEILSHRDSLAEQLLAADQLVKSESTEEIATEEVNIETPTTEESTTTEEVEDTKVEKGLGVEQDNTNEILKGIKGILIKNEAKQDEKFKAMGELSKSFSEQLEIFKGEMDQLKSQSVGRRSITTKKEHVIEKSFTANEPNTSDSAQKTLSLSGQKSVICDILTKSLTYDNSVEDNNLQKSILGLNMAGTFSPVIQQRLKQLGIDLVK